MNAPATSKEELEQRKLQLEVDILELEKEERGKKEPPLGTKWEVAKTVLSFLGWIVAAGSLVFSVLQFNKQQQEALDQREREQTEAALAKIQEDPLRLTLYLESYTEQAIPLLVEMVHVRHEEERWPHKELRALRSLEDSDAGLTADQLGLLHVEARRGWTIHEDWIGREPANRPIEKMRSMDEILFRIYALVGIDETNEEDRKWKTYSEAGRLKSVPEFEG